MREYKRKRRKITGWPAAAAIFTVLWLLLPLRAVFGAEDVIYMAGMPDPWPLEYYDSQSKSYQGVLPDILEEAAAQSGLGIHYVDPSETDNRLKLAENIQVDAVWTLELSEKELEEAGLRKSNISFVFLDGEEKLNICLAYTESMQEEDLKKLEAGLQGIDDARLENLLLQYAKSAYQEDRKPATYMWISISILLLAVLTLLLYLIRKRREVIRLAYQDELTGGDNFTAWKQKFSERINDGNREHYAVLFLDAGLETISHIYGYPESERVLQIIRDFCEPILDEKQEAMSRFNEFYYVFFLQYTSVDSIKERIGTIHEGIAEAVKKQQKRYFLEPHTGIYRMSGLETEPLKTIQRAEIASEFARNHFLGCAVYDEMVERETVTGYAMEHEAIHGLMHQEFIMYLQPIVEIGSGKIKGAEALVRWQNPGRGLMQPGDFLDVIKRKQLTGKMNMDIFRQGCRFLKEEADKGRKLDLLFNFTVENVGDEQFAEELNAVARQYGIDRDRIVIQLNQMVEMSRSDSFMDTIRRLRGYGFHICLAGLELDRVFFDFLDCGVDSIKLRHDLIRHVDKPEGKTVIESIMNFCRQLNLKVVCMGVENEAQAKYLESIGCDFATGFYYYYPVSQESFDELEAKQD